jgi:hypothetical protein
MDAAEAPRPEAAGREDDLMATLVVLGGGPEAQSYYRRMRVAICLLALAFAAVAARPLLDPGNSRFVHVAVDPYGAESRLVALDVPILSRSDLLAWTVTAVTRAYSLKFSSWPEQLEEARRDFTPEGYEGFRAALDRSGALARIVQGKYVASAVPNGAAKIVSYSELDGRPSWKIRVPLLVTYRVGPEGPSAPFTVTAVVSRVLGGPNPKELAITYFTD